MTRSPKTSTSPPPPPLIKPGHGGIIETPNPNDVLCGRGGRINSHAGNVRFRDIVQALKPTYLNPSTKKVEKAVIAAQVVSQIRGMHPPGRFLKEHEDTGKWVDIGDERARKKAGQALREDAPDIRAEMTTVSTPGGGGGANGGMSPKGETSPPGQSQGMMAGDFSLLGNVNPDFTNLAYGAGQCAMGGPPAQGGGYPPGTSAATPGGFPLPNGFPGGFPQDLNNVVGGQFGAVLSPFENRGNGQAPSVLNHPAMQQLFQQQQLSDQQQQVLQQALAARAFHGIPSIPTPQQQQQQQNQQEQRPSFIARNLNSQFVSPAYPTLAQQQEALRQSQHPGLQQQQQQLPQLLRGQTAPSRIGDEGQHHQQSSTLSNVKPLSATAAQNQSDGGYPLPGSSESALLSAMSRAEKNPLTQTLLRPLGIGDPKQAGRSKTESSASPSTNVASHSRKGIMDKYFTAQQQQTQQQDEMPLREPKESESRPEQQQQEEPTVLDEATMLNSIGSSLFGSSASGGSALSYLSGMSFGSCGGSGTSAAILEQIISKNGNSGRLETVPSSPPHSPHSGDAAQCGEDMETVGENIGRDVGVDSGAAARARADAESGASTPVSGANLAAGRQNKERTGSSSSASSGMGSATFRRLSPISSVPEDREGGSSTGGEHDSLDGGGGSDSTTPGEGSRRRGPGSHMNAAVNEEKTSPQMPTEAAAPSEEMKSSGNTNLTLSNLDAMGSGLRRSNSFPNLGSVSDVDMLSISESFFDDKGSITSSWRSGRPAPRGGSALRNHSSLTNQTASGISFKMEDEFFEHEEDDGLGSGADYFPPPGAIRAQRFGHNHHVMPERAENLNAMAVGGSDDGSSSGRSQSSSWLKPFNNMQSVGHEPLGQWHTESNRSILSDISVDLMALDLHTDLPSFRQQYHHS